MHVRILQFLSLAKSGGYDLPISSGSAEVSCGTESGDQLRPAFTLIFAITLSHNLNEAFCLQVRCRKTPEEVAMNLQQLRDQEAAFFAGHADLSARKSDMGSVALANRLDSIQRNLLTKTDIIATLITKVQQVPQSRAALLSMLSLTDYFKPGLCLPPPLTVP